MNNQKPSSLFWSWGAYVFLPINIIIGTIVSKEGASIEEILWALILALVLMMGLAYPAVCLSSKYGLNYAKSIKHFIKHGIVVKCLILLIPVINIGWYAIQTVLFVESLQIYCGSSNFMFVVLIVVMSYLFALGVTKYNYLWLKNVGIVGIMAMIIMLLFNFEIHNNIVFGSVRGGNILSYTIQIFGTWIFSSVTCIMDITSHVSDGKKGFKYIVIATILTNTLLIIFGYVIGIGIDDFVSTNILNLIAVLVAIWTTNDSNFYSTMCSFNAIGLSRKKIYLVVPLLSSLISIFLVRDFENFIVKWLSFMSWVGIPLGIMWWIIYIKEWRNAK